MFDDVRLHPLTVSPDLLVGDSVLRCSCCGNLEVRLGGREFRVHPAELPLLLDWLDALDDAPHPPGSPFVHYQPRILVGWEVLRVRPSHLGTLRTLLENALDVLDRSSPDDAGPFRISVTSHSLN